MSHQLASLCKLSPVLLSLAISGRGNEGSDSKAGPVDALWSEVQERFAQNGVTADAYYKTHPLRLSGEVLSIAASNQYAASLRLSDESPEPFVATIQREELPKVKEIQAGQYVTVVCGSVSHAETANDCKIDRIEPLSFAKPRKNRSLRNHPDSGAR